jgi:hypothetical protein
MTEQRDIYRIHGARDVDDLATQANLALSRISDRLDQMEGYRGNPSFKNHVFMNRNRLIDLDEPTEATQAATKNYADQFALPVGFVVLLTVATNPGTLLGYGTWTQIAQGQFLAGQKDGDSDFGTAADTGGSKTHTHDVDVGSTTSGNPTATVTVQSGTGALPASGGHKHTVDPASVTSGDSSDLPPYFVVYVWKRTA